MKVLYVTSEAAPFAASGGLADVASGLPKALRKRLIGCRVVLPLYDSISQELRDSMTFLTSITVPVSWRRQYCGIFQAKVDGVIYYLLDNQYYFKRAGLYGHYDDAERFAFFARAVLEMLPAIDFKPEIIHCNDWQTALTPVYYNLFYAERPEYQGMKTLYTIHNIQYQGKYGFDILSDVFGISDAYKGLMEFDKCVNLMKAGIESSKWVNTVSSTYSKELMDPWYSYGLDEILRRDSYKFSGILNGIDTGAYNPEIDSDIYAPFSAEHPEGKAQNKAGLQKELGLNLSASSPIIGIVSRLTSQKGLDLVKQILEDAVANDDIQVAVLGTGDAEYEDYFAYMSRKYPEKVSFTCSFVPSLARKIYAGSDMFLMPSKSEPCGLAQMISLRYGTVPIVRTTGGLKDSIIDVGDKNGNGFTFQTYNVGDLSYAISRALSSYRGSEWNSIVQRALECDFSWGRSANEYIRLYKSLIAK